MFKFSCLAMTASILVLAACNPASPADPVPPSDPENATIATPPERPVETAADVITPDAPVAAPEADLAEIERVCDTVSEDGMCGITFGMTAQEAHDAFPTRLYGDAEENPSCYYLRPNASDYGRAFMVVDGTVQRIDVRDENIQTRQGAGIGLSLDEVETMFETTERMPDKYEPDSETLKAELAEGVYAVFEEGGDGFVSAFRVGLEPAVDYVEGCA